MGTWLGIEWDDGMRGKHNGIVDGKRYFQTQKPMAGSFIRPGKLGPCATLEDADILQSFLRFSFHFYFIFSITRLHEHRHRLNFLFIGTRLTAFIEIHSLHLLFFWYFLSSPEYR